MNCRKDIWKLRVSMVFKIIVEWWKGVKGKVYKDM